MLVSAGVFRFNLIALHPCALGRRYVILDRSYISFEVGLMSPDVVRALAISGSILIAVVVFTIIISIVTVRRGEAEMAERAKKQGRAAH
jgi:hypothetical protein